MHVGHEFVTRKKSRKDLDEVLVNEIFVARDMDESNLSLTVANFVFEYVENELVKIFLWNEDRMQKTVQKKMPRMKNRNFGRKKISSKFWPKMTLIKLTVFLYGISSLTQ